MKKFVNYSILASTLVILVLLSSCTKDSDDPDYVDDYIPTLTENSGISYTGDYFPFANGNYWTWSGTATITGFVEASAMGESEKSPIDETSSAYSYMTVGSPISLILNSGTYTVFPADEPGDASRYFIKTDTSLLIKAIKYLDGNPTEVMDPVFIREPLVVGDKWASTPSVDMNEMMNNTSMEATEVDITTKCNLFVLGKENFYWNGQNNETVKLQERAQATGTINIDMNGMTGPLNVDVKIDIILLLLKDVGIVRQYGTMEMKISGKINYMGVDVNINMEMTQDQDLVLESYDIPGASKVVLNPNTNNESVTKAQRAYSKNPEINNLIHKIVQSALKVN
jgi:hypothetical protein